MNELATVEGETQDIPPAGKPFPGILASLGWIALYFVLQLIAAFIVTSILVLLQKMTTAVGDPAVDIMAVAMVPTNLLWGLVLAATLQIGCMWFYLRKGDRAAQLGLTHFGRLSFARTVLLAVGAIILATVFNHLYATYIIPGTPMQGDMAKMLASIPRTPINIALGLFAIAIAAPVIEELLFRGLLQTSLMRKMPPWAAIAASAFLFSLVHGQLYAIPALMSLGAAFGYIYYKTGSLRMTMLLHMLNNILALALTQAL